MNSTWTRRLLLALGVAAVLAPGGPSLAFGGIPLSVAGLAALAAVLYSGLALPRVSLVVSRWLGLGFVCVVVLKLGAAAAAPPLGLKASYFAGPSSTSVGVLERSTDYGWLGDATRIDTALDLRGEDFAAHFFNDAGRFNFGPDVSPGRDQLPFSVRWQGWLLVPSDGERRFVVDANGPVQVWLDDVSLAADSTLDLAAGLHTLRAEYARPEAGVPALRVRWQPTPGAPLAVLTAPDLRWQPSSASSAMGSALGLVADAVLVATLLAWFGLAVAGLVASGLGIRHLGARLGAFAARAHARGPTTPSAALSIRTQRHADRHTERHTGADERHTADEASDGRHTGTDERHTADEAGDGRHTGRHTGADERHTADEAGDGRHTGRHTGTDERHMERHAGVTPLALAALGLVPLVFLLYGALLEAPMAGRATILSGFDDWLVYESSARDILLSGLLMDGGQGHAPPFYGQPLYLYVLALAHRLTGESLFGPIVLQFAALGGVLVGTAVLARRAFGATLDGLVALASMLVLLQLEGEHFKIARQLFNENLYMPLVMASLVVLVGMARKRQPPPLRHAILAGLLLGLTAISRSQFLLFVPLGMLILLLAWRGEARIGLVKIAAIALGVILAIAPVTARNWIVSGQFVPISSSAGASLLEFHRPPSGLIDPSALQADPLYNALHLDQQTRTVIGFARADPRGYLATLAPLGAHSIGLQGRNDPGLSWPLLATFLVYLASFGLPAVRRLHMWPIHALVATHLLVLMLFEADTYGYRLVMPMYAPMVAVAAQVPLAVVRRLVRSPAAAFMRGGDAQRTTQFAQIGWGGVAVLAVLWQAAGLVSLWPDRETALHGLGGAAAHAATTSDRVGAAAIYIASIDGTPRRFGAGSLPGLRYPRFKWFDPMRSLPLPPESNTVVYMLSELSGHELNGDLTTCLGRPNPDAEVVAAGNAVRGQCSSGVLDAARVDVTFDGLARIDALQVPDTAVAGDALETRLVWQPLVAHPEPQQVSLQLDDPSAGDGTLSGNGTLDLYPASEWQPGETLLSRVPVATDPTAVPQAYRLTLGVGALRPSATPATALWQGSRTDRVPVATVTLSPGSAPLGQALPADMRALPGPPLVDGGLELIGARPLPQEAAIGSPLRIGLLWRAVRDQPDAAQLKLRLVRGSGEVVQESVLPLLRGRLAPAALHAGNVVRDEQNLLISPKVPNESLSLELLTMDSASGDAVQLGSVKLTGRSHAFEALSDPPMGRFGEAIELVSGQLEPTQIRSAEKVTVKLRWRAAAELQQAYKVFVHVLDPAGQQVVAQRDAEPQDGRAPTTGWVVGEVIDDEYAITLPPGLAAGGYPVEVGVYDPRSGDRLRLSNGDNRLVLAARFNVR